MPLLTTVSNTTNVTVSRLVQGYDPALGATGFSWGLDSLFNSSSANGTDNSTNPTTNNTTTTRIRPLGLRISPGMNVTAIKQHVERQLFTAVCEMPFDNMTTFYDIDTYEVESDKWSVVNNNDPRTLSVIPCSSPCFHSTHLHVSISFRAV
jgi:hypothetical protein